MRKPIMTLLSAYAIFICGFRSLSSAQTKCRALYVYEKNVGEYDTAFVVTPVMYADVDSIRFSYIDMDSIVCSMPVVQEIWTPSQVYRMSLEQIDSVSFQPLPTILKSKTIDLTQQPIRNYVSFASMEDMTVTFVNNTPSHLLPSANDFLVAMECGNQFGMGFIGKVSKISSSATGIAASCTECELTDVFEQYYGAFESVAASREKTDSETMAEYLTGDNNVSQYEFRSDLKLHNSNNGDYQEFKLKPKHIAIPEASLNLGEPEDWKKVLERIDSFEKSDDSSLSPKAGIDAYFTPAVRIKQFLMISPLHYKHQIDMDLSVHLDADMYFGGQIERTITFKADAIKLPVVIPLLMAGIEIGAEFKASGMVGIRFVRKSDFKLSCQYTSIFPGTLGTAKLGNTRFIPEYGKNDLILDGNVSLVGFVTPNLRFAHRSLASLLGKLYCGIEAKGNYTFTVEEFDESDKNQSFSQNLKDCGWSVGRILGFEVQGKLFGFESTLYRMPPFYTEWAKSRVVPNMKRKIITSQSDNKKTRVVMDVNGVVDVPRTIGIKIIRNEGQNNEDTVIWQEDHPYRSSDDMNNTEFSHEFPFSLTKEDKVYPIVEYYDKMVMGQQFFHDINAELLHPFTSYRHNKENRVRIISGATAIGSGNNNQSAAQAGNWLPFTYF